MEKMKQGSALTKGTGRGVSIDGPVRPRPSPDSSRSAFSMATTSLNPAGAPRSLGEEAGVGRAGKNKRKLLCSFAPPSCCASPRALALPVRLRRSPRSHSLRSIGWAGIVALEFLVAVCNDPDDDNVPVWGRLGDVLPFDVADDVLPAEIGEAWVRLGPASSLGRGSSLSLVSSGPLCELLLGLPWGAAPCALTATAVVGA